MTKAQVRAEEPLFARVDPQSGVQKIDRGGEEDAHAVLVSLLADADTGRLVEARDDATPSSLEDFAAALPELLGGGTAPQSLSFDRVETPAIDGLLDLVLVSPRRVHVAQRLPIDPRMALVSVASRSASIGWIVSEARARLTRM